MRMATTKATTSEATEVKNQAPDYESQYHNLMKQHMSYQEEMDAKVKQYEAALSELNRRYGRVLKLYNDLFTTYVTEAPENK